METQNRILKIQDEETRRACNDLDIYLKINIFGEANKTRQGVVNGILGFILDHYNLRKEETVAKYYKEKRGLNSVQQYILDRTCKKELDEINNEYSDTKEFCILFKNVLKSIGSAIGIINNQDKDINDLETFKELFVDASSKYQLLDSFKNDLIELSNIDFKEIDRNIQKMESILKNTKENIRFFIPSENRSSTFKDYMDKALKSFKIISSKLKEKFESCEILNSLQIQLEEPIIVENNEVNKQTI